MAWSWKNNKNKGELKMGLNQIECISVIGLIIIGLILALFTYETIE
jgi:hypothetical protein